MPLQPWKLKCVFSRNQTLQKAHVWPLCPNGIPSVQKKKHILGYFHFLQMVFHRVGGPQPMGQWPERQVNKNPQDLVFFLMFIYSVFMGLGVF